MDGFAVFLILVIVIVAIFDYILNRREETPHQRDIRLGLLNPELFCPHCQSKGNVRTKWVSQKAGVSGSKLRRRCSQAACLCWRSACLASRN